MIHGPQKHLPRSLVDSHSTLQILFIKYALVLSSGPLTKVTHPFIVGTMSLILMLLVWGCASQHKKLGTAVALGDLSQIEESLKKGAYANRPLSTSADNYTALQFAVSKDLLDMAKVLLEYRADPDLVYVTDLQDIGTDCAPLHVAACLGFSDMVSLLLAHDATVDLCDSSGETPLMKAIKCGHPNIVRFLLEAGADVSKISDLGWTPLFYAAIKEDTTITNMLIRMGADIYQKNGEGHNVILLCENRGKSDFARELIHTADTIELKRALSENTLSGYQRYAQRFPKGLRTTEALAKVESFSLQRDIFIKGLEEAIDNMSWGIPMWAEDDTPHKGLVVDDDMYPEWVNVTIKYNINQGTNYGGRGNTVEEAARLTAASMISGVITYCRLGYSRYKRQFKADLDINDDVNERQSLLPSQGTISVILYLSDWKGFDEGTDYHLLYSIEFNIQAWREGGRKMSITLRHI